MLRGGSGIGYTIDLTSLRMVIIFVVQCELDIVLSFFNERLLIQKYSNFNTATLSQVALICMAGNLVLNACFISRCKIPYTFNKVK